MVLFGLLLLVGASVLPAQNVPLISGGLGTLESKTLGPTLWAPLSDTCECVLPSAGKTRETSSDSSPSD
jgi:hypothetical protein